LEWEATSLGYTDFFRWALTGDLEKFYSGIRWPGWEQEVSAISADRCFDFYPPLWSQEGTAETSHRATVPAEEAFGAKRDLLRQMEDGAEP
jgi:hypothetical protein